MKPLKIKKIKEKKFNVKESYKKALAFFQKKDYYSASKEIRELHRKFPEHHDGLKLAFDIALALTDWRGALNVITKLSELYPSSRYTVNKGCVLIALSKFEEALKTFESVEQQEKLNPILYPVILINKGLAFRNLYRFHEAIEVLSKVKKLTPNDPNPAMHLGIAYHELNQYSLAINEYKDALKIDPRNGDVYWNLAISLLASGDYVTGWQAHEWRFDQKYQKVMVYPSTDAKPWDLKTIEPGMRLMVEMEQGIGDYIQFTRFIKPLADKGVYVILASSKELYHLAQQIEGVSEVYVPEMFPQPKADYWCPFGSLPLALGITLENMPPPTQKFEAPSNKKELWKKKLVNNGRPKVGVIWAGNPNFSLDYRRSIPYEDFIKALPEGIDYYCISKEMSDKDQFLCSQDGRIKMLGNEIQDWLDTEAIIDELDLIIGVSTSVPALSASMNKETWLLLSYSADWRWGFNRDDSPWFPAIKIYRQATPGSDWTNVLNKVKEELTKKFITAPVAELV